MPAPRKIWTRLLAIGLIVGASLTACSQFSIYSQFQPLTVAGQSGTGVGTLTVKPGVSGTLVGGNLYFTATGGVAPYTFKVLSGGAGGTITSSGAYTAPKSAGSDTVQATDADGRVSNATVTVVSAPPLQISPVNLQLNTNDSYAFRASGGVPPYSFSITTAGTSDTISPAGQFTANATGTVSVQVSDSLTNTAGTPATVTVVSAGGGGTLILSPGSPLTGSGSAVTIPGDRTLYLVASGGTGSYTGGISITSGKGSAPQTVGSTGDTWTYTSGGNLGNSTLTLTDSVSNTATAKVTFEPTAPSNLVATAVSGTEIDLTWTNNTSSSSISGIDIYRAVGNGGFGSTPIASALAGSLSSYQDTGLSSGTVYVYKVVAVKNGVGGPFNGTSNYAVAATQ